METKGEKLDISDDEGVSYHIIHRNNPILVTDASIECANSIEKNDTKIYTPLKTIDSNKFKYPRRLSVPLIKSPTAHAETTCFRSNGNKSLSPRKLGARKFGRSHYDKLRSPKKWQDVDLDQKSQTFDSDEKIVEKVESMKYSESIIPDANIPTLSNGNKHDNSDESDKDIFASQELDNHNQIINNSECEGYYQQLTPLKVMKEKLEKSSIDTEKLFLTPQSVGKRDISSDSEFERVCNSIKNNNFDPGHFSFETMDLLNGFDDLDDIASERILSDMLGLSVNNGEIKNESLTDPLAISPEKMNSLEQFNGKSSAKKRTKRRKLLNENGRRSSRLQEKSNNEPIENDSSSTAKELRDPQKTNGPERFDGKSSSNKRTKRRKLLNENRIRSTRLEKESNNEPIENDLSSTDEELRNSQKTNGSEQFDGKSSSNKQTKQRELLNENRRRSTRLQKISNDKLVENDASSTDEELRNVREKIKEVEKEEAIPPETIARLKNLDIKLEHEPLPQHQLETYISRPPTLDIKKSFVQYGPLKKGAYLKSEDKIIKQNWKRFCDIHDWDPLDVKPFVNVRINNIKNLRKVIKKEQRIKFVQFLAQGLPWRLLFSVFARFRSLYTRKKKELRYTPEEDAQIMIYMEKETRSSQKFSQLAELLKRTKNSISCRYVHLKNRLSAKRKPQNEIKWNVPLIEKFLKHLLKVTLSKNIYDLKNAVIPKIVWVTLEKKLNIPHDTMMFFWLRQLHAQLFCTRPIYDIDIKIMLIEYLYVKGISHTQDIIWSGVAKYFDGLTPHYLSQQFYTLVQGVPLKRKKNLAGIIGWLYEKKIPQLTTKIKDKYLPRLNYKKGKIEIIKECRSSSSSSSSLDSSESD